jgi:hypothetical protein
MISLVSIDTTPNPNSMKLSLSAGLGISGTFTKDNTPCDHITVQQLLDIQGVVSVFITASFLTLNRDPRVAWPPILEAAQKIFGGQVQPNPQDEQHVTANLEGQVKVLVQTFRQIPIQVKVTDGVQEERIGLPSRFGNTAGDSRHAWGQIILKSVNGQTGAYDMVLCMRWRKE